MEILGPPKAGAVSVGVGVTPELPAWHWCLGERDPKACWKDTRLG